MAVRGRKPGRKAKDVSITDGFNPEKKLTPQEKRAIKQQKELLAAARKKVKEMKAQKSGSDDDPDDDDGKNPSSENDAYQMLEDMRWVYRRVGGREKLRKFIKKNDKAFELMVKELMKIESAMKQAQIKKDGGGPGGSGNQSVFVVLKGLEEEQKVMMVVPGADGQSQIDIRSMASVLKPADALEDNAEIPLDDEETIRPEKG